MIETQTNTHTKARWHLSAFFDNLAIIIIQYFSILIMLSNSCELQVSLPVWCRGILLCLPLQLYSILLNCWLTMRLLRMPQTWYTKGADSQHTVPLLYRVVNWCHFWGLSFLISHYSLVRLDRHALFVPSHV